LHGTNTTGALAGAADDGCGDGVQFEAETSTGLTRFDTGGQGDTGESGEHRGIAIDDDLDQLDIDAGDDGSLFITTESIDMTAELRPSQDDVAEDGHDDQKQDRHRNGADKTCTEEVEAVGEIADRLATGDEEGCTTGSGHHTEGDDEGRQFEIGDDQAIDDTSDSTDCQAEENGDNQGVLANGINVLAGCILDRVGKGCRHDGRQGEDGTGRQVNAGGDDDDRDTDTDQADKGNLADDVHQVDRF